MEQIALVGDAHQPEQSLTTIRAFDPQGYGASPTNLSRWSLKKVDEASLLPSHQRQAPQGRLFRASNRCLDRSFSFSEFSAIGLIDGALVFKSMPGAELDLHLPLPDHASIRSCTLTKEGRTWRVALQIEVADVHAVRRKAGNLVGIDWGVERLATLSTGETIANPRFGAEAATGIGKAQRRLVRAKKQIAPSAESHGASGAAGLQARQPSQEPFASADRCDRSPAP